MTLTPGEPFSTAVIRRMWYQHEWFYSLVDVIAVLTDSANPNRYWNTLKGRLKSEGAQQALDGVIQLRLQSRDNRLRSTDVANRETLLRLIQSIPSPKAEPFKQWLASVGDERLTEIENPEAAFERIRATYRARGYDDRWIDERMRADLIRNELTTEWKDRGAAEGLQFAILTNTIHTGTFALGVAAHKEFKSLVKRENLRDHMTPIELALISLGEATAIELHRDRDSQGFPALRRDAGDAGTTAGKARRVIEADLGRPILSAQRHHGLQAQSPGQKLEALPPAPEPEADLPQQLPLFLDPL
ncbi:MAG: Bro-N domain-containing protein [Roseiflexaceae bacterium]|nr:Bro-N domain-containing protein [Roseiflexaceae bacterium]